MVSDIDPVLAKSLLDTTIKELGKTDIECEKELTIDSTKVRTRTNYNPS